MRTPQPTKPIDCFTEEQKQWAVERLKQEFPDIWERMVRRKASNMKILTLSDDETEYFDIDGVLITRRISSLPLDYGEDGWGPNREGIIFGAFVDAALDEAKKRFLGGN